MPKKLSEFFDNLRVKSFARIIDDVIPGLLVCPGFAPWPVGTQRVPAIHDGEDPGRKGDL